MHPHTEDRHFQFQTTRSPSSSSKSVPRTISISIPAFRSSTPVPGATCPSTTIFSRSSSTAAIA
jgi:hypothetical protein